MTKHAVAKAGADKLAVMISADLHSWQSAQLLPCKQRQCAFASQHEGGGISH